jgi:hypothetical protein
MLYSQTAHAAGGSGFFFNGDPNAPVDSIKVADADVQTAINLPQGATYSFDSKAVFSTVAAPIPTASAILAAAKNVAYSSIDSQAGAARAKYITTVAGQPETYLSKATDAAAYKAASYPFASLASYPWVQAEAVAINGASPTAAQVKAAADGILAAQTAWVTLGAQIEQARRAGSVAVAAASTVVAVQAAQAAAIATLAAM